VFVDVSAKQKTNLNLLMKMICLTADLQELKATPGRAASDWCSKRNSTADAGPSAQSWCRTARSTPATISWWQRLRKVRAMFDDRSKPIKEAPPRPALKSSASKACRRRRSVRRGHRPRKSARISEYREQKSAKPRWPRVPAFRSKGPGGFLRGYGLDVR